MTNQPKHGWHPRREDAEAPRSARAGCYRCRELWEARDARRVFHAYRWGKMTLAPPKEVQTWGLPALFARFDLSAIRSSFPITQPLAEDFVHVGKAWRGVRSWQPAWIGKSWTSFAGARVGPVSSCSSM